MARRRRDPVAVTLDPAARERAGLIAAIAILIGILLLTSTPSFAASAPERLVFCLSCHERRTADALVNVLLFAPLGASLAVAGWPLRRIARVSLGTSTAIEVMQYWIPGRYSDVVDLVSNTGGGIVGAWLALHAFAWLRAARPARRLWGAAAVVPLVVALTGWCLAPGATLPAYAHWRPDFATTEQWTGEVRQVRFDGVVFPEGWVADPPAVRAWLLREPAIGVEAHAGRATRRVSPIFMITDSLQRDVLMIGALGEDLLWQPRTRAANLLLDAPGFRFEGALAGIAPGAPLTLEVVPTADGPCLTVNGATRCHRAPSAASAWAILYSPETWRAARRRSLDLVTSALLLLPIGALLGRVTRRAAAGATLVVLAGSAAAAVLTGLAPPGALESAGAALGLAVGVGLDQLVRRAGGGERGADAAAPPAASLPAA